MTYVELHCHSNYSFQEGASSVDELLARAAELEYPALALTDHDNLCGAMHFAQVARSLDVQPITGAEVTLQGGGHLTLLASDSAGYANLCGLISRSYIEADRRNPELDPKHLPRQSQGLVLLTGCRKGPVPSLVARGRMEEAESALREYAEWLGPEGVFVELQQNLVHGDTGRNRRLVELARKVGVRVVATNKVHYHVPERHRLQDALVAIRNNKSLEETHQERRPNSHFHLKSSSEMAALFKDCPEALSNTLLVAERCSFDLTRDLGYKFPDYPVPHGHTQLSYLEELCHQAAIRRYGRINWRVRKRLSDEFRLIKKHNLAGFLLIYHDIIQMARDIQIELGLSDPEIPLEERPPGRGRGSSVAMLTGYLIGLSHIDPLKFDLSLDRFLQEDMASVPDIDLDFSRNIREELIKRVHERWGWDRAALSGMISTYRIKGAVRDLGKALGLPFQDVDRLAKRVESYSAASLRDEMEQLPEFRDRTDAPVWRDLIQLAAQLDGFPKYLAQHPGGMIISSSPLTEIVPVQQSAIDDRFICHWDKDAIDDAGFVKIDFLALGALSQLQDALQLIEERTGSYIDLSRIDFEDAAVYDMMHRADTVGIFQVESAAQMQAIIRIKPRNLTDMAFEVGAVRPGVGVNDGVTQFIRRRQGESWDYDHPLERRALERTLGIILFQDQVNQVAIEVAGFSALEADQLRRAFRRRNNESLIATYRKKFLERSAERGVPEDVAEKIFKKFNGQYMFPESHAFAFGVTAYHMTWLKHYYPLEFFVAIFNQQPMGFYNLETLKEDARRHDVPVLNPDINASVEKCIIASSAFNLGHPPGPLPGRKGVRSVSEGHPFGVLRAGSQAPGNPDASGLHTPFYQHPANSSARRVPWTDPNMGAGRALLHQPASRHGSGAREALQEEALLVGFLNVSGIGAAAAKAIVEARELGGPYTSLGDAMRRAGLQRESIEDLVLAGAFDSLISDRRSALWEVGLRYRPTPPVRSTSKGRSTSDGRGKSNGVGKAMPKAQRLPRQQPLEIPVEQDMASLTPMTGWEEMAGEYQTMSLYPQGHLMEHMRPHLSRDILPSDELPHLQEGMDVWVAGLVIRRQRPLGKTVFITLEDEFGHIPLIVWPSVYDRYRLVMREPVLKVRGKVSRREGTLNIAVTHAESLQTLRTTPSAKNWG